jgi:hypothetical protein
MDRRIRAIRKDRKGNIVTLCNAGESWSPRRKADVIADITSNRRSYYVKEAASRSYVRVVAGDTLESTKDEASPNNLNNLPVS